MGETNRLKNLKYRGAMVAACAGLAIAAMACSDDTTATTMGDGSTPDTSTTTPDSSSTVDAPRDTAAPDATDATTDSASPPAEAGRDASDATTTGDASDGSPGDSPVADSRSDATDASPGDARADATDAPSDAPVDEGVDARGEASADAAPEASPDAAGMAALSMCKVLDQTWGIDTDAAGCDTMSGSLCPDRANTWVGDIVITYLTSDTLNTDCRIASLFTGLTPDEVNTYESDLATFTFAVFGCPVPGMDGGSNAYGLVPANLTTWQFTSADIQLLSDAYVTAVRASLTGDSPSSIDLTPQQVSDLNARLAYLASLLPNVVPSASYSSNMCPADAGTEGGAITDAADGG
jgi:hypothetical protein